MSLCGWIYLLAIAGMYYLASYDTAHDISWWVSTGLDRMLMPGLLLAWAGGVAGLQVLIPGLAAQPARMTRLGCPAMISYAPLTSR